MVTFITCITSLMIQTGLSFNQERIYCEANRAQASGPLLRSWERLEVNIHFHTNFVLVKKIV